MTNEQTTATSQPGEVRSSEGLGRTLVERLRGGVYGTNRIALCEEAAAELERLRSALTKANDQAEAFERAWYLRGDALESIRRHCEIQPSALAVAIVATCDSGLRAASEPRERFFSFEFEVWQGDEMQASATGPRDTALREAMHYAAQYGQDGPVRVFEVTRVLVSP